MERATWLGSPGVSPDPEDDVEEIILTLPASAPYARVARLTVTGLAARVGYSYDDIEDLRIAVGEQCSLLLSAEADRLTFRCRLGPTDLQVDATREPVGPPVTPTELTRQILTAVVDEFEVDPPAARVRITKRLTE